MNQFEIRTAVRRGEVTLGMLRAVMENEDYEPSARSTLNPRLIKAQAFEILSRALAADTRLDSTVMNRVPHDVLMATNILREFGFPPPSQGLKR